MQLEIATLTRQGARDYNEDRFGQWTDGRHTLCVVADGAGGHGGGDVAAQTVCDAVLSAFAAQPSLDTQLLRSIVLQANQRIQARQQEGGRLAAMRSTVILAAFDLTAERMVWAHSGDSRAYLFRGQMIAARTNDHSLVQQMVVSGLVDDESARLHPQRSVLLSALGAPEAEIEVAVSEPMRLEVGDDVLLCSDGVWEVLGDQRLMASMSDSGSARQWAAQVEHEVVRVGKANQDNFTGVFLRVHAFDAQQTRIVT